MTSLDPYQLAAIAILSGVMLVAIGLAVVFGDRQ